LIHGNNALVIDMGMCLRVPIVDPITKQRFLITPQGTCGKWHYMSPEICNNTEPFDGHAVDLWAVGVILFLMLTGYPPWEKPVLTDERFRFMSNGYLVHMLTEWKTGLTPDAMDLLQRMFWIDPTDRLSLDQVCAHPWMQKND
jgi:serine/threonine protein kinase